MNSVVSIVLKSFDAIRPTSFRLRCYFLSGDTRPFLFYYAAAAGAAFVDFLADIFYLLMHLKFLNINNYD